MAQIMQSLVDCAPGNAISVPCSGFQAGPVALLAPLQGAQKLSTMSIAGSVVAGAEGALQSLQFTVPDKIVSDLLTVTDTATTPNSAQLGLRINSQYLQSSEYIGEGVDTSGLAPGELDVILKRASSYADSYIGNTLRILQWFEQHHYRETRRIFPFHRHIVSLDSLVYAAAPTVKVSFDPLNDVYINTSAGYFEILAYAFGNYALLTRLEMIGFAANVLEIEVTCGYSYLNYPQKLRDAVTMIATALLQERRLQHLGLGGLTAIDGQTLVRDTRTPFDIPKPAKDLLRPYVARAFR